MINEFEGTNMIDYINKRDKSYKKAIFFDRDGTIIVDTVMPYRISDLRLFDDTITALREASKLNAYIIIVTNQSGIALGKYTTEDMHIFHQNLIGVLEKEGIQVHGLLYCPHYDVKNYPNGYEGCNCSKPKPGLLLEAEEIFDINIQDSVFIGDKHSDIGAGIGAKCKANILVTTGIYKYGTYKDEPLAKLYEPTVVVSSLMEAVKYTKHLI